MCNRNRFPLLALCAMALLFTGCAEGPMWRLGYLNPWVVKRWHDEEEFLSSLSSRQQEIEAIADRAGKMEPYEADQAAEFLRQAVLEEEVLIVRIEALRTLGKIPSPVAADALVGFLNDPDPDIRLASAKTLGERPAVEAVGALRRVIEVENDIDIRLAAARALANYPGNHAAVAALEIALTDPEPALQYRAMESLAEVTGKDFGHDARQWQAFLRGQNPPERNANLPNILRDLF